MPACLCTVIYYLKREDITYRIVLIKRFREFLQGVKKLDIVLRFVSVVCNSAVNIAPVL
jgi:hypothetical protein